MHKAHDTQFYTPHCAAHRRRLISVLQRLLAAYSERSLVITPKHVRGAARALEGKEYGGEIHTGWFGKAVPYLVPAILLLCVLFFVAYKGLANL